MVRFERKYFAGRLFDRDFLYGVFPSSGFVKDPEEFLRASEECSCNDAECDGDKCQSTDEDSQ